MFYFIARELEGGYNELYESNTKVKEGDFVVIPNYEDKPVTAEVVKLVSKFKALSSRELPQEIISVVDMKTWNTKREKELENNILLGKMEDKIKEISMLEKLEKFAGKDPEMLAMLQQFKGQTSLEESEVEE